MNNIIKLKINLDQNDQKQSILEILEKLQGEIILEYDGQKQNALIQNRNLIVDQNDIFHLDFQNQLQQDPQWQQQNFNQAIGISKKLKFIAIHNLMKNHFYQKAQLSQIKIYPDWTLSEYRTNQKLNANQQILLNHINMQIQSSVVFSVFCKNQIEKASKIGFLWKSLDKLAKIFDTNQENLLIGEIKEPHDQVICLKRLVFILNFNQNMQQQQQDPLILQKQVLLNGFIQDNFNIHTFVFSIKKPKCTRIELKEIVSEIVKQHKNINIKVGYNRFDISSFLKLAYIEIEQYDDYYNVDQQFQQEIQDRASKIFKLNLQDKLNFENYICKLPLITNSNINFKHCKQGIKLNNSIQQIKQFVAQVNIHLKQLKSSSLYLKVDQTLTYYFDQIGIEQKKQILKKLFMDVTQQQYILSINDIKMQNIEVLVYFNRVLNNDIITLEQVLNQTLSKLQVYNLQMNELNQLELTIEQFQQKYFALVHVENNKIICIIHSNHLNQMLNLLDSKKQLSLLSYKPKSKLYALQICQDYKNKIVQQSQEILSIKLSQSGEIIYLECPTKNMAVLEIFAKYEKILDNQLLEIPIGISKMEAKYLYRNCQKEIQIASDQQIFELLFNFNEYQTPTDSGDMKQFEIKKQDSKNQFIKFLTKEVNFETNLMCEVFIKFNSKLNVDQKIIFQKEDKVHSNIIGIREYFQYCQKQKLPFKQIGVLIEDVKDIFPKLLQVFMCSDQTKFQQLTIFIDNLKLKPLYEQELINSLVTSMRDTYQDFQWQWSDGRQYNDYDDAMINEQIEVAYQSYKADNKKNELMLKFPCSYQPGTHTIDINKGTILDHASGQVKILKQKDGLYQIGNEQADDILSQYINERIQMKKYQFTVFLKKYLILFKSKDEMYQINQDTKYKRRLRREIKTDKYFQFIHEFLKQKQTVETLQDTPNPNNQIYCRAKAFINQVQDIEQAKQNQIEKVKQAIQNIIEKHLITFEIILPSTNDQIYFSFLNYLNNNALKIEGEFNQNQSIQIKSFEKSQQLILEVVEFLQQIPQDWNPSSYQSLYYFDELQPDLEVVRQAFPFLDIKTIQLVQNYDIWAKYQSTKSKLKNQNEELMLFGYKKDCAQEEIGRVTLSLSFDHHTGPYVKCGKTVAYIKDNYCESQKGEKQIIVVQVLLGLVQELKQQFLISDHSENNFREGDYYYIKGNRIYPKFIITLKDQ
ncbi:unnamed protein product (macronuclear) [Paramecium tetraurelia]|uniref:WWE domain-containing protein n=1 Tax=Paramecium tetraurelia TaxID=5888 RepID=A0BLJ2_PARTE|nr:uncharacterized protein GSPATT00030042001 [Paramecium tetraurelia]CAK59409.1 unnamed protein product [Paramecium tetraurelia]|eukprot:XP_001426807.1 hypothetical protein (macronuclear) [Paramecium tetraurelia strain d4-2]